MHTIKPIVGIRGRRQAGRLAVVTIMIGGLIGAAMLGLQLIRGMRGSESSSSVVSSSDTTPKGLSAEQWQGIKEAHDASKRSVRQDGDGWKAENPGQGLTAQFDRRGMEVRPESGGWRWGLELTSYGVGAAQTPIEGQASAVRTEAQRVAYDWDANLEEWYQNDARGFEHGYTIRRRPAAASASDPLALRLQVRGGLRAIGPVEGRNLAFGRDQGGTLLRYSDLKVFDADGRELAARFEADGEEAFRIVVEDQGAIYPVTIDPTISQEAYLKASNAAAGDNFGYSVAISGDTVVVGAIGGDAPSGGAANVGTVYVYVRNGATWTQQAILTASNADANDRFGESVAISGNTVVIGAPDEASSSTALPSDNTKLRTGAAYVFVRNGTSWTEEALLKAGNGEIDDLFGRSVAISGDTVVVGANYEDSSAMGVDNNTKIDSGAAYVFVRSGTSWTEQARLKASDADDGDNFGVSVAISGDTVVIGAPQETPSSSLFFVGSAYVFARSGTTWNQQAILTASNRANFDIFGWSVAISGDTVVVGAYNKSSGVAYVFVRSGTTWSEQAILQAANRDIGDKFGFSVAISGDMVVVGAFGEDSSPTGGSTDNSVLGAGIAYVFVRSGTTWSEQYYVKARNAEADDNAGRSVAISGGRVVVGAYYEDSSAMGGEANNSASNAGAAYVFPPNTPPNITASGVTRTPGSAGSSSTIATVTDGESAAGSLTVTVTSANPTGGVTISNIVNTNGTITADITAASAATAGTVNFTLQVSDGLQTATATLTVTVSSAGGGGAIVADNPIVSGGGEVVAPGSPVMITQKLNNTSSSPTSTTYVATLPAGFSAISCTAPTGSCVIATVPLMSPGDGGNGLRLRNSLTAMTTTQTFTWTGTVPGNGSVTLTYLVQVSPLATGGSQYCVTTTVNGTQGATTCLATAAAAGPGIPSVQSLAQAESQKPGSVLIYNIYTSGLNTNANDSRMTITNVNPTRRAYVHLFFVDGASCAVADMTITLTQNQTKSFMVSDMDPGVTGYLIAVATDENGCPTTQNDLIGESLVKFESGHRAALPALGVVGLGVGVQTCDQNTTTTTLNFDGLSYDTLPRTLAISSLPSIANGNSTLLVVNRIGGDLGVGAGRLGSLFGLLYDDMEVSQSFTLVGNVCQLRGVLGNNFPRTAPRYTAVIPAGRSGWMKFWASDDQAITGAVIQEGQFSGGHNLHHLTTTNTATLTIPVFPNQ